jgi:hypothetical protein
MEDMTRRVKTESKRKKNKPVTKENVDCFYTNANSIVAKMTEIRERTLEYDIIGISESWGREKIGDAELTIDGFDMFRKDRKDRIGGGVLLYVKENLKASLHEQLSSSSF